MIPNLQIREIQSRESKNMPKIRQLKCENTGAIRVWFSKKCIVVLKRNGQKPPFGKHDSTNCFRQKSSMDAKISGQRLHEEKDLYIVWKCLLRGYLSFTKGKAVTLQ